MANTKQAAKRARQSTKNRQANVSLRSTLRTAIKKVQKAIAAGDHKAAEAGVPMAELVRTAVRRMRELDEASFQELLQRTKGIWKRGDGMAYQRRIRREWR